MSGVFFFIVLVATEKLCKKRRQFYFQRQGTKLSDRKEMKANEAKQSNGLNPVSFSSFHCFRIAIYSEFPSFLLIKT